MAEFIIGVTIIFGVTCEVIGTDNRYCGKLEMSEVNSVLSRKRGYWTHWRGSSCLKL